MTQQRPAPVLLTRGGFANGEAERWAQTMSKIEFTPEENRLMALYTSMARGVGPRVRSWAAEIIPAILLLIYGISANKPVFIVAGFLPLLFFSSMRMFKQFKYAHLIQDICKKIAAHQTEQTNAQPTSPGDVATRAAPEK